MGQRFVPDSYIFRQLIDRAVPGRALPKGLDLFAVMGSERALEHLETAGDARMPGYRRQFDKIEQIVTALRRYDLDPEPVLVVAPRVTPDAWHRWATATRSSCARMPGWTSNSTPRSARGANCATTHCCMPSRSMPKWARARCRHQSPSRPKGYVEPVPEVYARISALGTHDHRRPQRSRPVARHPTNRR